jgi:hypothetical protein
VFFLKSSALPGKAKYKVCSTMALADFETLCPPTVRAIRQPRTAQSQQRESNFRP